MFEGMNKPCNYRQPVVQGGRGQISSLIYLREKGEKYGVGEGNLHKGLKKEVGGSSAHLKSLDQ